MNANTILAHALNKNGRPQQAVALADAVVDLLAADLAQGGQWHEAYNGDTGAPLAAPGFLSWDVLGATLVLAVEPPPRAARSVSVSTSYFRPPFLQSAA